MNDSFRAARSSGSRRVLTWLGLAVAVALLAVLLFVAIAVISELAGSKPLSPGESRGGQVVVTAACLALAALCGFWIVRAGRRLSRAGDGHRLASSALQFYAASRPSGGNQISTGWTKQGRGRRARRGKPLSEMTPGEIKRAMWLAPVWMGIVVLSAAARIAVAAIEERMAAWLAVVLIVLIAAWSTVIVIRTRRRYRSRLRELRDSITGALPGDPAPPLPLRVWALLICTPLMIVAALVLVAVLPGEGNTCVSTGIATSQAHQGTCQRQANLFGVGVTYYVVDAGETLQMPGYQASLLASSVALINVDGPNATVAAYPNHRGLLVSYQLHITNSGRLPLQLPVADVVSLLTPSSPGSDEDTQWQPSTDVSSAPIPQLALAAPLSPGQTTEGWISFIVPPSIEPMLTARPADLDFYPASETHNYIGQIRLWKAANAAGSTALQLQPASNQGP